MSAHEHLNPRLFNPGPRQQTRSQSVSPEPTPSYGSAHSMPGDWVANPVERLHGDIIASATLEGEAQEEFVPTERMFSAQPEVNAAAIEHQVEHANPLALDSDPLIYPFDHVDGKEGFAIRDGNHRVAAAQRRGQLLVPSRVVRR